MSLWTAEPIRSLYVHVPFCAHKCEYCAFYSQAPNGAVVNRFVAALIRELQLIAHDLRPETIFFGGGTPSLLNLQQWQDILRQMDRLELVGAKEWTVECNPATVSLDKARLLRSFGVNRISMGVQSLDERLLERLGRIHSRDMVFKSFDTLRAAGFENINIDLMFAIPGQTMQIWRDTLGEALTLGSEHLSCYEVIYEEDTPLYAQLQAGEFDVDDGLACDMFEELVSFAGKRGFTSTRSPILRGIRAQPRLRSRIALASTTSITGALAPSTAWGRARRATSAVCGTKNWSNTTLYCEQLERGVHAIESTSNCRLGDSCG